MLLSNPLRFNYPLRAAVSFPDSVHLELQQPKEGTTNINSKSSLMQTTLNIVKLCIGTGVLAIPFAATEGGLVFHIIGLCFIAMWNSYSVHRLLESRSYIQNYKITLGANESFDDEKEEAPKNTNEFGYVTWHAFGWAGLQLADSIMIMLMLGIIVAYEGKMKENCIFCCLCSFYFLVHLFSLVSIISLRSGNSWICSSYTVYFRI